MKNKNIMTVWALQVNGVLYAYAHQPKGTKAVKCIFMTYGEYLKLKKQSKAGVK